MITSALSKIAIFLGWPTVILFASLLVIVIIRICISFVFKLLRLNIDYHSLQSKTKWLNIRNWK